MTKNIRPKAQYGTCSITINHRVPVKRIFDGWTDYINDDGTKRGSWKYVLLRNKVRRITKEDIVDFFNQDGELDDTFDLKE